ncbi:MAG TPA: hypothetical protein VFE17_08440 [Candidatus Baltobacteraceae bacterium]|jgi:hypothetical protein|nr:hypothetical protein [Candidatus Baltobacteraceae bacterium]
MKTRFVAAAAAVLFMFSAAHAAAQSTPAPASTRAPSPVPGVPAGIEQDAVNALGNVVKSVFGWSDTESLGTVTYYRGYDMQMRMQLDRYRSIHLHRGTVINPRGYTIKDGDTVDVRGRPNSDGSLTADMIVVRNPH